MLGKFMDRFRLTTTNIVSTTLASIEVVGGRPFTNDESRWDLKMGIIQSAASVKSCWDKKTGILHRPGNMATESKRSFWL